MCMPHAISDADAPYSELFNSWRQFIWCFLSTRDTTCFYVDGDPDYNVTVFLAYYHVVASASFSMWACRCSTLDIAPERMGLVLLCHSMTKLPVLGVDSETARPSRSGFMWWF